MHDTPMHLSMFAEYEQLAEDVRTAQRRMADVRATADSDDGLVSATVGGGGELVELWLDPRIYRAPDSAALAADILDTVRQAARLAQQECLTIVSAFMPPDVDVDTADLRFDPLLRELDRQVAGGESR
ncbi:YbaB/EbfC family nucleoid-associated protein [Actinocrispum wychmicini]|uniref:YbaB/EbfC DNA-binding family protein n=1 Tax=Actinocrispum wychmicini TaxID=1213861 RepID=A0A4R2J854_9PSEU|nr:YbaB/EbfC family nucleoid-associated protein [Actinocrispum wychmicini]TCO54784.1 hypothetical protein EV192_10872 [Actinocrispum wychmicini]